MVRELGYEYFFFFLLQFKYDWFVVGKRILYIYKI